MHRADSVEYHLDNFISDNICFRDEMTASVIQHKYFHMMLKTAFQNLKPLLVFCNDYKKREL